MKTHEFLWRMATIVIAVMMTGCEKQDAVSNIETSSKDEILSAINELSDKIHCRRSQRTDWFAYSNICCAVRQLADANKRRVYSIDYTNKVSKLLPRAVDVRAEDSVENWRIAMENYVYLVRWGAVLSNENLSMDLGMWDFLLCPISLIRQEINSHKQWLFSKKLDSRHVEKNYHVRMLGDLLYCCKREIELFWYPEAKRKLTPEQLQQVRQKVKKALGELPPEMAKDE